MGTTRVDLYSLSHRLTIERKKKKRSIVIRRKKVQNREELRTLLSIGCIADATQMHKTNWNVKLETVMRKN